MATRRDLVRRCMKNKPQLSCKCNTKNVIITEELRLIRVLSNSMYSNGKRSSENTSAKNIISVKDLRNCQHWKPSMGYRDENRLGLASLFGAI